MNALGLKRPRQRDERHLVFIRQLPCLSCLRAAPSQAAHVRYGDLSRDKPSAGIGEKPSDRYVVPLCDWCHVTGPEAQHRVGEDRFWSRLGIDPLAVAEALYEASGDVSRGTLIVLRARQRGK